MKNLLKYSKLWALFIGLSILFFTSCDEGEEDEPTPEPTASFTFSPDAPEVGQEITFTSTSENATSFSWSFGDGGTATGENTTHSYESAGEFTVTLVASGEGGNLTVEETVTVAEPEPQADPVQVYFADNTGDVFTMQKISGLGLETTVETAFETTGYTIQVFYDENNDKIYYSDDDNGQVVRVNPDGSGEEIVAEGIAGPRGLAVNDDATKLFVADRGADEILSFDLSTGEKTVLYDSADLANAIVDAEFQPAAFLPEGLTFHNGELFFTCVDFDAETLWKATADGASVSRLLDYGEAGFGYAVIVDTENDVLIFDDADTNNLLAVNYDGSGIEEVVATDDYTYGIGIDYVTSKIYWSTRDGSVKRANRDGSEVETLVSADEGRVNRGLVIVPTN
ncbi:PKD domain-containing protein [Marivirga harenae]|uniref:PKD domain-containing protein n=1 Tax=Marivirga harenae TaxID=2010992 RepID=UPI0026E0001E|nr:PKD domain-containing protein [Marivirga harenae]WKV13842.1 PKD domain-containing protein [Marivirga harenae]